MRPCLGVASDEKEEEMVADCLCSYTHKQADTTKGSPSGGQGKDGGKGGRKEEEEDKEGY